MNFLLRAFVVASAILTLNARAQTPAAPFQLTCLEVADSGAGIGLALILQTPGGHTFLYDTGAGYPDSTDPTGWRNGVNTAHDQILPFLAANHITAIDGVIISHAHLDHYGGLLYLADHFPVRRLYDTGYEFHGPMPDNYVSELSGYNQLRQRFKDRGAYQQVHAGDKLALDPALDVEVLAPPAGFFTQLSPADHTPTDPPAHYLLNANSTDIRIRYGKVVFLLPGDIQKADLERLLLTSVPPAKLRADVLVAPAHGHNPISAKFAQTVRPSVVISSVFPRFFYKANDGRKIYGAVGAKDYVTADNGWIRVVSDGVGYTVTTERIGPQVHGVSVPGLTENFTAQDIR